MSLILSNNDFINKSLLNTDSGIEFVALNSQYINCGLPTKLSSLTGAFSFSLNIMVTANSTDSNVVNLFGNHDNTPFYRIGSSFMIGYLNLNKALSVQIFNGIDRVNAGVYIKQGVWYNIVVTVEPNVSLKVYKNGVLSANKVNTFANVNTPLKDILVNAGYAAGSINFYNNSIINNIVVYDKTLTDFEVYHHIYLHGGEVRSPLHNNIVYHLPLTQNYSHKVIAGDKALTKGLVIGDNAAFDVSSRYNYSKTTIIEDTHAKFINFTDAEIGITDNSTASAFKDFYNPVIEKQWTNGTLSDGHLLELKTGLPKISECLLIEGQKYVSYPTTNLPGDTEDYTLMVSGWITDVNPVPLATLNHFETLLMLADKNTSVNFGPGIRLTFMWSPFSIGASNLKPIVINYKPQSNAIISVSEDRQYNYYAQMIMVIKGGSIIEFYINGQLSKRESIITKINPSTFFTKLFRSGYLNWDDNPYGLSNISQLYLSQMGYWKRALDGWEIASLYNNSQLGNPFALNNRQGTGFQDKLEQYFQFQTGSIYKDTGIYYVKNQADVLKGTWTSGQTNDAVLSSLYTDAELITTPTKIIKTNSLR